ncbi:MAG: hypothetical protein E6G56_04005 [Actinobacteria bacterium]|nr:MAG: hypothetical protein E6G56_04005 [Actinomycetota bacterium]
MPAEGQWRRQQRAIPLTRRDRGLLAVLAVVLLVGAAAIVYAGVHASGPRAPGAGSGCVEATVPGATGAQILHTCGASARRLCLTEGARADAVASALRAACRRAGLPLQAPPGPGANRRPAVR